MTKERVNWIDQVKGFAIFLMVYAHNSPAIEPYIYSFHMPLFLIVSGFFLPNNNPIENIKIRFRKIIIPYFIWVAFLFLFWVLLAKDIGESSSLNLSTSKNFIGIFYAQGAREYMDWGIPMWFLPMIFLAFCIVILLKQITSNIYYQLGLSFVLALIGSSITTNLPWSINVAMVASFFIIFGNLLFNRIKELDWKTALFLCFVFLILHFFVYQENFTKIDMYRSVYGNFFIFITAALLGSSAFILFLN